MTDAPELVIEAGRAERQYWRDLWRYRELFYILGLWSAKPLLHWPSLWRDIAVRYKQTVIGVAWASWSSGLLLIQWA